MRRQRLHSSSSSDDEFPSVNLTPLIDVVFVVLIGFIIVAPVLEIDNVELAAGPNSLSDAVTMVEEAGMIAIHVDKDDQITFNRSAVSIKRLGDLLIEAKVKFPEVRPQLFHDQRARFGTYQSIKNSVEEAGFEQMDVVLKPGG